MSSQIQREISDMLVTDSVGPAASFCESFLSRPTPQSMPLASPDACAADNFRPFSRTRRSRCPKVIQKALSPERALGQDLQLSVVPSVTAVHITNDLQVGRQPVGWGEAV